MKGYAYQWCKVKAFDRGLLVFYLPELFCFVEYFRLI